jgi:tRNA threonylcarbamoyl adenosine modification protein YjeE
MARCRFEDRFQHTGFAGSTLTPFLKLRVRPDMNSSLTFCCQNEQETVQFGTQLADALQPGITVALHAELGSGKTCLVRAVGRALGADQSQINSPTFVLMQCYPDGRIPVYHFDTYRLNDVDEFLAIGGDEYLSDPTAVCFVEWAERVAEVLPADHLAIQITQTGESSRQFTLQSHGPKSESILQAISRNSGNTAE